jgi:hypothetical protein
MQRQSPAHPRSKNAAALTVRETCLPIPVLNQFGGKIVTFQSVSIRERLGELLLEPLIDHFSDGPSLLTSAAHVLGAGHDPGRLRLARG